MSAKSLFRNCILAVAIALGAVSTASAGAKDFTIEQVISPAYPSELVAAKKADRIAWIAYERGMRNVYTAAGPDYRPVRLTNHTEDDGVDLTGLTIADDGSVVAFVRGHTPNRDGWIANPASDPKGAERVTWAVQTTGGAPRKVAMTGNPVLSPDGRWVLFLKDGQFHRSAVDSQMAQSEADRGEKPFLVVYGTNSNPRWSPDSNKIAFVSNRTDHSFVGVYDINKRKVSYLAPSVDFDTSPTWSADGRQIAFIRRPGTPFGQQDRGGAGGGRGGQAGRGRRGGAQQKGQDKAKANEPPANRANVPGLNRATLKGGYTLAFYVADAETGEAREFWHNAPDEREFTTINSIQWVGDSVMFTRAAQQWTNYYTVPVAGNAKAPVLLPTGEGMVEFTGLSGDGKSLYYCSNVEDIDRRHIWKVPTGGGSAERITSGNDIETYPAVPGSGDKVAMLFAGAKHPLSVAVVGATGGTPRVIFPHLKDFPSDDHVVPQNVTLKAVDGMEVHNQLFLPSDLKPGERRPAMVFVHGGPVRQMLLGYHYMHFYHMAYGINQYLANHGYIVMSVNYRGGIGYGRRFQNAPQRGANGNSEYQDVLVAGQYLKDRPDVDPKRIGIWGLSYGGVLTAQALARNSDIFSAGVDLAGIHLWGNSLDPNDVSYKSSSISQIDKWKSPVLLIHGDDDRNVAFAQTTGLVQLLRANNIYHELIVFPDDVHDSLLYRRWLIAFHAADDFFQRFLKADH